MTGELIETGPWIAEAAGIVDEMDDVPVRDLAIARLKVLLVQALRHELNIWSGDHSEVAKTNYQDATKEVDSLWREIEIARKLIG